MTTAAFIGHGLKTRGLPSPTAGWSRAMPTRAACGSFNANFRWLAETGLGITGIGNGQDTHQFLTIPGGVCIDSKWIGNVRTATESFQELKCFKFYGHYWVTHGGINYDVCYNNTFHATSEIIWTNLIAADPDVAGRGGLNAQSLYKLEKPIPAGDYLVKLPGTGPTAGRSGKSSRKHRSEALPR